MSKPHGEPEFYYRPNHVNGDKFRENFDRIFRKGKTDFSKNPNPNPPGEIPDMTSEQIETWAEGISERLSDSTQN